MLCIAAIIKLDFEVKTFSSYSNQVNKISKILIALTKTFCYRAGCSSVTSLRATLDNARSGCSYIKALRKIVIEFRWWKWLKIHHIDTSIAFKKINATVRKIKKMKFEWTKLEVQIC